MKLLGINALALPAMMLAVVACGRQVNEHNTLADSLELTVDGSTLSDRITAVDLPVTIEGLALDSKTVTTAFSLTLVAHVAPPAIGDLKLQATKVVLAGKRAYVSYNVAGEVQAGAIDVISLSDSTPRLTSQLVSKDADINALAIDSDTLFAVGAKAGKAFARRIELKSGELSLAVQDVVLPSFAGTGVAVTSGQLLVTTGSAGGLASLKKTDLSTTTFTALTDARDVATGKSGDQIFAVAGTSGRIAQIGENGGLAATVDVGGATIAESKSTIEVGKHTTLVALGDGGAKLFCGGGTSLLAAIPAMTIPGGQAGLTVTNAASASGSLLFTANGEGGVRVHGVRSAKNSDKCEHIDLPLLGALNFGEKLSANSVVFDGAYLYVATGLGGLEIVRVNGLKSGDGDSDEFDN